MNTPSKHNNKIESDRNLTRQRSRRRSRLRRSTQNSPHQTGETSVPPTTACATSPPATTNAPSACTPRRNAPRICASISPVMMFTLLLLLIRQKCRWPFPSVTAADVSPATSGIVSAVVPSARAANTNENPTSHDPHARADGLALPSQFSIGRGIETGRDGPFHSSGGPYGRLLRLLLCLSRISF